MATYDYHCSTCGKRFEWVQSMKDDALTTCPPEVCSNDPKGQGTVERQISAGAGVIYKGAGFYLTDYAKKDTSSTPAAPPAAEASPTPPKTDA